MAPEASQIGFDQLGIAAIIKNHLLSVPPHQREYSWTDQEVSALFQDINKAITDSQPVYFLGSVVTIPKDGNALEVVDGQQRLATTAILLAAIRNKLKPSAADEAIVTDLSDGFLTAVDRAARAKVSKLRLNVTDHEYFQRRIIDCDTTVTASAHSHRLIADAADIAAEYVDSLVQGHAPKNHGDVLNRWIDYLQYKAQVVLLKVPSEVNAYRMFETLNARGLRTSQADLVKNHLFGQAAGRLDEAQHKWSGMRLVLESFEDDDITVNFLRQMMISLYGYMREDDVYDEVTSRAKGVPQSLAFLAKLEKGAIDYAAILNSEHVKWASYPPSIRKAIAALGIVRVRAMRPLMLAVAREFSEKEAERAMRLILQMSVRLMIAGGATSAARSGQVETAIAEAARRVSEKKNTTADAIRKDLDHVIPKDNQFEQAFAVATQANVKIARYLLRSLEMAWKKEPNPQFVPNEDASAVSLEHVFPHTTEGNWSEFTPEDADSFYRRLGNMALLATKINSDLKSSPFADKKDAFKGSAFELTAQIATLDQWTTSEISARQKKMAELAVKTWPLTV